MAVYDYYIKRKLHKDIWLSDPLANEKRAILAIWKGLGYSMSSLDTRVKRNFGVESFAWLHDTRSVCMLLSDLQRRERARKRKQDVNG